MIISVYPLIGKNSLTSSNEEKVFGMPRFVDLTSGIDKDIEGWEKEYVSVVHLLSEVGFDVIVMFDEEVLKELDTRGHEALIVMPSPDLKNEMVRRAFDQAFSQELSFDNFKLAERIATNFDNDLSMLYSLTVPNENLHGVMITNPDMDLEYLVNQMKNLPLFKGDNRHHTFVWGIPLNEYEEANLVTENKIQLTLDEQINKYVLKVNKKYMGGESYMEFIRLYGKFHTWYYDSYFSRRERDREVTITQQNILENGLIIGSTIKEILLTLYKYIYSASDN